jgi:hypothetical protein
LIVGFEGERCEINIDDCASEPCVHGACIDGVADYTCDCDDRWEGNNCDDYVGESPLVTSNIRIFTEHLTNVYCKEMIE